MQYTEIKFKRFATQIDESALEGLRTYAKITGGSISGIVTEAVEENLKRASIRPAFRDAMDEVFEDHAELLNWSAR